MARRGTVDPGFGVTLFSTLTGKVAESIEKRRQAEQELKVVFAKALAEQRLKQAFPSAEEEAQRGVLSMANEAGRVPEPVGGYNSAERQLDLPNRVSEVAQQRKLEFLKYLLPNRGTSSLPVNVYTVADGKVTPAEGGQNLPPRSRVIVPPLTAEMFGSRERARQEARAETLPLREEEAARIARAKVQAAPGPERVQAETAIDSMLQSLDDMEQFLTEDPTRLLKVNIPFAEREFAAIMNQFDKEAAIAAGGKQLTTTELNLIRQTRPTIQDFRDPAAIRRKLTKLRQIGQTAQARLEGKPRPSAGQRVGRFLIEAE